MVLEQDRDTILEKANSETAITLRDNKGKLLFHGYATNIQFRLEGGLHYLHLEAEGASSKLDIAKRSRTFFKQGITYKEIIKTVLQSYPGAGIDAHVKLDRKADFPIIQYQETDWEFEISTNNSWAMNLEQPQMAGRHRRTFTYGLSADSRGKQLYDALTPRDALAFDLYDVKRIFIEDKVYDSKARQALKNYIDSYTTLQLLKIVPLLLNQHF